MGGLASPSRTPLEHSPPARAPPPRNSGETVDKATVGGPLASGGHVSVTDEGGRAAAYHRPVDPLPITATGERRAERYREVMAVIGSLLADEDDWVAAMASVACELHGAFAYYDWTGFYRAVSSDLLVVGPYQGAHGCLRIAFDRGVCGAAARTRTVQRIDDVDAFDGHIACSTSTRSEIVVPVVTPADVLLGVLDVDSNAPAAFTAADQDGLEALCGELGRRFADTTQR